MKSREKLSLFACLYFAQGLPYGFFTQALPVFLREANASLAAIGGAALLTLPWALKFLWAPFADRYGMRQFGLRRSWIVPLQIGAVIFLACNAFFDPQATLLPILVSFLICNLLAATQDVATDGLAVDLLTDHERGWANGVQVGAYRIGMIVGGSAMLIVLSNIGWSGTMLTMACMLSFATLPILFFRENDVLPYNRESAMTSRRQPLHEIGAMITQPGVLGWLTILLVYKLGHQAASAMMRPWLVDQGYSMSEIGQLMGFVGSGAGLFGAVLGGWVASRFHWRKSLVALAVLQVFATLGYLVTVFGDHDAWKVAVAAAFDNGVSGVATVVLFAAMMEHCRPHHSASDYTLQASIVVVSQTLASTFSGLSAQAFGYRTHFTLVCVLGAAIAAYVAWTIRKSNLLRNSAAATLLAAVLATMIYSPQSRAQAAGAGAGAASGGPSYEFGIGFGPLLPSRIAGVREVMNGWALRGSIYTSKGVFELEWFNAISEGVRYNSNSLDYRLDFEDSGALKAIPIHFMLGGHWDMFQTPSGGSKAGGGWHYGGGVSLPMTDSTFLRADFKQRFSPGSSLIVLVGFSLAL